MSTRYQECVELSQKLTLEVKNLSTQMEKLRNSISRVSAFGFDGLNFKESIEALDKKIRDLKKEVGKVRDSIGTIASNASFSSSQLSEIGKIWKQMVEEAKSIEASIIEAKNFLKKANFWAALACGLEQLYKDVQELIVNLSQPIIREAQKRLKQATEIFLPGWE